MCKTSVKRGKIINAGFIIRLRDGMRLLRRRRDWLLLPSANSSPAVF